MKLNKQINGNITRKIYGMPGDIVVFVNPEMVKSKLAQNKPNTVLVVKHFSREEPPFAVYRKDLDIDDV